jgi:CheY-like chemotaxis protein/nitrogen-specific signal transduction histidine kinase
MFALGAEGLFMARSGIKQKSEPRRRKPRKPSPRRAAAPASREGAKEAVLAVFAHDIRTALTGILALGELLASSNLGERERRWAVGIKSSAEHLASLTTLVIDAAKADAGSLVLQREVFRPRRLIEALRETFTARAETKGLRAEVTIADDMPDLLLGDPVRLRAALENLVDNAVKFTEHGAVKLEARVDRGGRGRVKFVVVVTDSGIGIARAEIKRLFRPFAQASAAIARRYGGAGLGLAVVRVLARLMGGDLDVASTPGRGSRFRFSAVLPLAPAEAAANVRERQSVVPAPRLKILCAEDNPYGRVILNTILTELGHHADFVGSGEEAVDAVARRYDVVLMDITLSGIDGLEATRRIRALGATAAKTPIIGISGRTEPGDGEAARAAGMDDYLRKPISPSTLSAAIAAVVPA